MKTYIGVKILRAEPCNLGLYNQLRGWTIPADEDPQRAGYMLRYPDGYLSWSPKEIFDGAYRLVSDEECLLVSGESIGRTQRVRGAVASADIGEPVETGPGSVENPLEFGS